MLFTTWARHTIIATSPGDLIYRDDDVLNLEFRVGVRACKIRVTNVTAGAACFSGILVIVTEGRVNARQDKSVSGKSEESHSSCDDYTPSSCLSTR